MSDSYTEEELQALPQTEKVFDLPQINLNDHQLVQEGYTVTDQCHSTSFTIPSGTTLKKEGARYTLVPEL